MARIEVGRWIMGHYSSIGKQLPRLEAECCLVAMVASACEAPELCGEIEMRVRREPVSTICGWLLDEPDGESARQSEGQEEPWQLMTRSFLWDWQPNSTESVEILKHFDVWTGDADSDMRCDNYEVLLSTIQCCWCKLQRMEPKCSVRRDKAKPSCLAEMPEESHIGAASWSALGGRLS